MITISVPFDCSFAVYLNSNAAIANGKKCIKKCSKRGVQTFTFIEELDKIPDRLFWNIHFEHFDVSSRKLSFLKEDMHTGTACDKCAAIKEELREEFYEDMTKMINFRGHGGIHNVFHRKTHWEPFTQDEVITILKLIHFGIPAFNFTISSSTELDEEYKGIQLKTKLVDENGYLN